MGPSQVNRAMGLGQNSGPPVSSKEVLGGQNTKNSDFSNLKPLNHLYAQKLIYNENLGIIGAENEKKIKILEGGIFAIRP